MILRGCVGYVLVLLGGLVTSPVPASSGLGGWPVVGLLRETMPGRMVGLTVVVTGLGLASAAWLALVRYAGRTATGSIATRTTVVHRASLAWCAPLLLAPAMFSRDGWSYAAQGRLWALGLSPYEWTPAVLDGPVVAAVDPRWMDTLTPYGPLPVVWGAIAATATSDPWALVVAHRGLALVGLALLAYAVPRLATWSGRDPAVASALVLSSPLMLAHGIAGLHNDVLMVGLVALALVVAVERSWVVAAALGGVAAAVKAPAGLVCIGVVLVSLPGLASRGARLRRLLQVGTLSVAALLGVGVASGLGLGWVQALSVPGEVRSVLSLTTQVGQALGHALGLVTWPSGEPPEVEAVVMVARGVGLLTALGAAAVVCLCAPTGVPTAAVRAVALVLLAVVALGPVVHHWYALWFLPLLATAALGRRGSAAVLHASWLLGLVAPLDSSLRGAGTAIALTSALVGAVALVQLRSNRVATRPGPPQAVTPATSTGATGR